MPTTEVYPNAHTLNPYYSNPIRYNPANMNAGIACSLFCNAISDAYRALRARQLDANDAEYENQLVRLSSSPAALPSQGPPLPPHEVTPTGEIQFLFGDYRNVFRRP